MDLDAWRDDFTRWGLRRFVWRRLMIAFRRRLVLCRVNVRATNASATPLRRVGGCDIRLATREELLRAAQDSRCGLKAADVDVALRRGDRCVGAFDRDRLVGYSWRSFTVARWAPHMWVTFAKPYRYGHKGWTDPAYRGRRISSTLSSYMDHVCANDGFTHTISMIETHNYPSIEASKYRPAKLVGYAGYLTWRGRHYPFRTPGVVPHGLRLRYVEDGSMDGSAEGRKPTRIAAAR